MPCKGLKKLAGNFCDCLYLKPSYGDDDLYRIEKNTAMGIDSPLFFPTNAFNIHASAFQRLLGNVGVLRGDFCASKTKIYFICVII